MKQLGVIDAIVEEPVGGAHRQIEQALASLSAELNQQLAALDGLSLMHFRLTGGINISPWVSLFILSLIRFQLAHLYSG